MKPEAKSETLLSITRSKAKMYEYGVPEEDHIRIPIAPNRLFPLAIGQLGDFAASFISTDEGSDQRPEFEGDIRFSSYFFDSYFQSRLNEDSSSYNLLLSSASYYLCGLPGSSSVQIKRLGGECPDLEAEGLENLLAWLLNGEFEEGLELTGRVFSEFVNGISAAWRGFVKTGNGSQQIFDLAKELRRFAYTNGTPRQLLFTDVICTLIQKRHENSSWSSLPSYSDIQPGFAG